MLPAGQRRLQGTGSPTVSADGRIPPIPALGTHDPKRIEFGKNYAAKVGLPKLALEFQMLYGIRRDLQDACLQEGYPVRIYVPYGTHWYPYFMRRLAERPANMWFFISNFFRR
jgi:proline dehydrogenase